MDVVGDDAKRVSPVGWVPGGAMELQGLRSHYAMIAP
jgi:hypothetical protein